MDDIFQRFFGFSQRGRSNDWDPNIEPLYDDPSQSQFLQQEHLFRHFELHLQEVLRNFGFNDFSVPIDVPQPEGIEPPDSGSLRDDMLKRPDTDMNRSDISVNDHQPWFSKFFGLPTGMWRESQDQHMEDIDLDSAVSSKGIGSLLKSPDTFVAPSSPVVSGGFYFSSSFVIFGGKDSKVQQKVIRRDHLGNEETTITRRQGNQEYSVKTKKGDNGVEEGEETFVNIDEKNLPDFEHKWAAPGNNAPDNHYLKLHTSQDSMPIGLLDLLFKIFR